MEKRPPLPMTPLDMLVTSSQMQILKLMIPYLPDSFRGMMAVFIKFNEFQNTLRLFGNKPEAGILEGKPLHSPMDFMEELRPFMNPKDLETIDTLLNVLNMIEMMQGMEMPDFSAFSDMGDMSGMMDMFNNLMKGNDNNE